MRVKNKNILTLICTMFICCMLVCIGSSKVSAKDDEGTNAPISQQVSNGTETKEDMDKPPSGTAGESTTKETVGEPTLDTEGETTTKETMGEFASAGEEDKKGTEVKGNAASGGESKGGIDDIGTGEIGDTWSISNYLELKSFADAVNQGGDNRSLNANLTNDIECTDDKWTPIAESKDNAYRGTFNGHGFVIRGLSNAEMTGSESVGLFGYTRGAHIFYLGLENVNLKGSHYLGGIVGFAQGGRSVDAGGAEGQLGVVGGIHDCYIGGNTTFTCQDSNYDKSYIGGIVGYAEEMDMPAQIYLGCDIKRCYNCTSGTVQAPPGKDVYFGGIVGGLSTTIEYNTDYEKSVVRECYNCSDSTIGQNIYAGALVGIATANTLITSSYYDKRVCNKAIVYESTGIVDSSDGLLTEGMTGINALDGLGYDDENSDWSMTEHHLYMDESTPKIYLCYPVTSVFVSEGNDSISSWAPKRSANVTLTFDQTSFTYNGSSQKPSITGLSYSCSGYQDSVTFNLVESQDYEVLYQKQINGKWEGVEDCVDSGEYRVVVKGKGAYSGELDAEFTIAPMSIAGASVSLNKTSVVYNGEEQKPLVVEVKLNNTILRDNDYAVSYSDGDWIKRNTYEVIVTGKGNYKDTVSVLFTINPASLNITGTITATDKIYDGNTDATLKCTDVEIEGTCEGDDVSVSATGTFNNRKVGENKPITLRLTGTDAANYTIGNQPEVKASITPYEIDDYNKLMTFATMVNGGTYGGTTYAAYSDLPAILKKDIVCTHGTGTTADATDWVPIGNDTNSYSGTFDGQGHTITGLYVVTRSQYAGFFGYVSSSGIVRNVGLIDATINLTLDATVDDYVGAVVAYNLGTVETCYTNGFTEIGSSVSLFGSYSRNVGGVIGYNGGTVKKCYNIGSVNASGYYSSGSCSKYTGGVVGYNSSSVENCYNTGNIEDDANGQKFIGGVIGGNEKTILKCYNVGEIKVQSESGVVYVGGVLGENKKTVTSCYNTGNISGTSNYVGGLVGYNANITAKISNCYNIGFISKTGGSIGGVVGMNTSTFLSQAAIYYCYYDSTVLREISACGYGSVSSDSILAGLTTDQMTGTGAIGAGTMNFTYTAPDESPWLVKRHTLYGSIDSAQYYMFYPHLKGFDFVPNTDPPQQQTGGQIAVSAWPPKLSTGADITCDPIEFPYDQLPHVPDVTVTIADGATTLESGTDYTLTYKNQAGDSINANDCVDLGLYTVYIDEVPQEFKIIPNPDVSCKVRIIQPESGAVINVYRGVDADNETVKDNVYVEVNDRQTVAIGTLLTVVGQSQFGSQLDKIRYKMGEDTDYRDLDGDTLICMGDVTITAGVGFSHHKLILEADPNIAVSLTSDQENNDFIEHNTQVTITATTKTGYKFIGWYDGDLQLTDVAIYKYTFNMTRDVKYIAKYVPTNQKTIVYMSDGNIYHKANPTFDESKGGYSWDEPSNPIPMCGFTFKKWDLDKDEIQGSLDASNFVTVIATFKPVESTFTVTVYDQHSIQNPNVHNDVPSGWFQVEAASEAGFSHWIKDGTYQTICSYNRKINLIIVEDTILRAVYDTSGESTEVSAVIRSVHYDAVSKSMSVVVDIDPKGKEIVQAGIVADVSAEKCTLQEATYQKFSTDAVGKSSSVSYTWVLNKLTSESTDGINPGDMLYVRGYVVYKDGDIEKTSYSKESYHAIAGADYYRDEKAVALIESARYESNVGKAVFEVNISVPDGCIISSAGVVAAKPGFNDPLIWETAHYKNVSTRAIGEAKPLHYTWTKTQVNNAPGQWRARAFVFYNTQEGEEHKVYGNTYTLNV